jgi:hypothetical protein
MIFVNSMSDLFHELVPVEFLKPFSVMLRAHWQRGGRTPKAGGLGRGEDTRDRAICIPAKECLRSVEASR